MQIAHYLACCGSAHSCCLLFPENWTFSASRRDLDTLWGSSECLSFALPSWKTEPCKPSGSNVQKPSAKASKCPDFSPATQTAFLPPAHSQHIAMGWSTRNLGRDSHQCSEVACSSAQLQGTLHSTGSSGNTSTGCVPVGIASAPCIAGRLSGLSGIWPSSFALA